MTIIAVEDVSIIFGQNVDNALELADRGASRSEIQAETDLVLGVHDCSLNIQEGEILVLMGLSGSGNRPSCARLIGSIRFHAAA